MMNDDTAPLSVSQLNRQVRYWLEQEVGHVRVLGEISNLRKPASGHLYFTLKDDQAQLCCVFFCTHHKSSTYALKDGQQVILEGRLSLYELRGEYQLMVHQVHAAGLGELYLQFEQLKKKLESQGLFSPTRKKPLKPYPLNIAIISSENGAALHDIIITLKRRYPIAALCVYPSDVQGKLAAPQLIKALQQANTDCRADVIILARGGGSLEDLWSFNDEQLALAICNSKIPVVSGIGHETDFTIADFVADLRAATPTAAAEAVTPDKEEILHRINHLSERIELAAKRIIIQKKWQLNNFQNQLLSPKHIISNYWQTIDYLERSLNQFLNRFLQVQTHAVNAQLLRLKNKEPHLFLQQIRAKLHFLEHQLSQNMHHRLERFQQRLNKPLHSLAALNPLATLERGYAIASMNSNILFNVDQIAINDIIQVRLAKGHLRCQVLTKEISDAD